MMGRQHQRVDWPWMESHTAESREPRGVEEAGCKISRLRDRWSWRRKHFLLLTRIAMEGLGYPFCFVLLWFFVVKLDSVVCNLHDLKSFWQYLRRAIAEGVLHMHRSPVDAYESQILSPVFFKTVNQRDAELICLYIWFYFFDDFFFLFKRAVVIGGLLLQHASVSQGQTCSDSCTCCHTEIEVADQISITPSLSILATGQPVPALTL